MIKKDAMAVARRITRYLQAHGDNHIIGIIRRGTGRRDWVVDVPADLLKIWPNIADLLTEY